MALTKADLKDASLFFKAGRIDETRKILRHSGDPRALAALARLDARFPPSIEMQTSLSEDDLSEVKALIKQKRFDEAEALLRSSEHPRADALLRKLAAKRAAPETAQPSTKPFIQGVLLSFLSSVKRP